ncbi:MAG: nucleotide exchange factor GrpE [Chromatiaceae bacterium]
MEETVKDTLIARFRAYLDTADALGETDDVDDEPTPDLFTLLAEVSALKSEAKLESRQVKSALDEFRSLFDALHEANARLSDEQERRREHDQTARRQDQKDLLLELLDLRDRLQAGHDQAVRFRPGWLTGRSGAGFVTSMAEGMAMNLRRLDEILGRRGVRPLPAAGQDFDPQTMHAVEVASDSGQPAGRVVRELRKGFMHGDRLLRAAEVVVNRPTED